MTAVPAEGTRPLRPRPAVTADTAWFFEGARRHRLLLQRCTRCGRLRHPPGPVCPACLSYDWDTVEASGRGELYSYTVNHHPKVPAFDYPLVVGLIALEEGVRMVSDLVDVDAADVWIGMPVEVEFVECDPDLILPLFRPATTDGAVPEPAAPDPAAGHD